MSAASAEDVRSSLRRLLQTVDMDTTTERQIRDELAKELGQPMDPFKQLIKGEIDAWLTGGQGAGDQAAASSQDPVGGRKRAAPAAAAAGGGAGRPAKVARGGEGGQPELGMQLDTQGVKRVSVSTFKGQQRVDLRTFFRDREGRLAPTKKGISLSQQEWSALQGVVDALQQALEQQDESFVAELPNSIRATVSSFGGKLQAGIRQYYESEGELKPGLKGISLLPDQLEALIDALPDINKQLEAGPAAAAAAAPAGAAAPAAAAAAGRAGTAGRAGQAAAAAGGGGGGDGVSVELGGRKRAAISTFSGAPRVDLREMYEKDGQLLPGKKGISLDARQWRLLVDAAEDISAALNAHNTRYCLELGNKRCVAISEFKGVWYVGVREYYEQNGQLKPGQKGLSMNREQWQKLVAGMNSLTAELG